MHDELKILFEKMFSQNASVYKTHGRDEMGRDLIISKKEPTGTENIAVVVKMNKLSGSASGKILFEIVTQVNQCFEVPKSVNDQLEPLVTNQVYVCIFGDISNKAQTNLNASLTPHKGRVKFFDIEKMLNFFSEYYPNIFLGASTLEALHSKHEELECKMFAKNKLLKNAFIEPNLRMFKKSRQELLAISKSSDNDKIGKTIGENIFGEKETIHSIATKALKTPHKMLIEGEAGSGKTVFVLKLAMHIIEETIHHVNVSKKEELEGIKSPIIIKASKLNNGRCLKDVIDSYYKEQTRQLSPNLLIVDGVDEVNNTTKEKIIKETEEYADKKRISLIFTTRKSTEVKKRLQNYENYELLPFETSQAINYFKKIVEHNHVLLNALIKGLEQLKHQIPLYPMSLSLLIEIAEKQKEVPSSISELYKQYIDMAVSQYRDGEEISLLFEPRIKMKFLEEIAYKLFYKKNISLVKRKEFDRFLEDYMDNSSMINNKESFLDDIERTSLLKVGNFHVEFLHKSFLDYFIASFFKNRQTDLYETGEFDAIYSLYHSSLWEDVTYFYFGQKTRITKQEIDKILSSTPDDHPEIIKHLDEFMIGKLLQFAWLTDSSDKIHAIEKSIINILDLRKELADFTEKEIGIAMPKILGDVQMLHYMDESFSSRWLCEESKEVIDEAFKLNDNPNLFYFATLYVLGNSSLIGNDYTRKFLDKFLDISETMPPEISVPLVNMMTLFIRSNKIKSTEQQSKMLTKVTLKLRKRYEKTTFDYLSFKNKFDEIKIRNLGKANKKS